MPLPPSSSPDAAARLAGLLRSLGRVAVAFSGGADSVALAAAAAEALPGACLAVHADSPLQPRAERDACRGLAAAIGVPLVTVQVPLEAMPFRVDNPPDRCYHCKRLVFARLIEAARAAGFDTLVDGTQLDDLDDYRPGRRALQELGVRSPLLEAGWRKADVLADVARRGLRLAVAPGGACLATRIPHGEALTAEKLAAVERAEAALRELGFDGVRVRHHGAVARVELPAEALPRLLDAALRARADAAVRAAGFRHVAVDLAGYRRGGMNAPLTAPP